MTRTAAFARDTALPCKRLTARTYAELFFEIGAKMRCIQSGWCCCEYANDEPSPNQVRTEHARGFHVRKFTGLTGAQQEPAALHRDGGCRRRDRVHRLFCVRDR